MFDRILFPTDGSEGAEAVLEHALDLAAAHDATLSVLYVADTNDVSLLQMDGEVVDVLESEGEEVVAAAADRARERGVDCETDVLQGEVYSTIVDYAAREADLVVMPTHGRQGLERFLLGSVTERVLRRSEVPVLTVQPDAEPRYPYERVLVPTDGSDPADAALSVAVDLAGAADADLHLLSAVALTGLGVDVRSGMQVEVLKDGAESILERAAEQATAAGLEPTARTVEFVSSIPGAVRDYVTEHDVDLVVVGTHGRTGFDRYVLGSVAESLVRTCPVPVLTVRGPEGREE